MQAVVLVLERTGTVINLDRLTALIVCHGLPALIGILNTAHATFGLTLISRLFKRGEGTLQFIVNLPSAGFPAIPAKLGLASLIPQRQASTGIDALRQQRAPGQGVQVVKVGTEHGTGLCQSKQPRIPALSDTSGAQCLVGGDPGIDMNTAFDLEVRQPCPKARVVYDLFHVVTKYGREVIDRVRVDEANRLRHDKPARKVIKQSRWLLLRNPENLNTPEQQVRLQDLLAANQTLMTVYLMKAELKTLGLRQRLGAGEWLGNNGCAMPMKAKYPP